MAYLVSITSRAERDLTQLYSQINAENSSARGVELDCAALRAAKNWHGQQLAGRRVGPQLGPVPQPGAVSPGGGVRAPLPFAAALDRRPQERGDGAAAGERFDLAHPPGVEGGEVAVPGG